MGNKEASREAPAAAGPETCGVCGGPALPVEGACAFCLSPLGTEGSGTGLLDYVARVVPRARARRGFFRRGPVRRLLVAADGEPFTGRLRKAGLELAPEPDPAAWAYRLAGALASDSAGDHELRRALTRAGWALRRP